MKARPPSVPTTAPATTPPLVLLPAAAAAAVGSDLADVWVAHPGGTGDPDGRVFMADVPEGFELIPLPMRWNGSLVGVGTVSADDEAGAAD